MLGPFAPEAKATGSGQQDGEVSPTAPLSPTCTVQYQQEPLGRQLRLVANVRGTLLFFGSQ